MARASPLSSRAQPVSGGTGQQLWRHCWRNSSSRSSSARALSTWGACSRNCTPKSLAPRATSTPSSGPWSAAAASSSASHSSSRWRLRGRAVCSTSTELPRHCSSCCQFCQRASWRRSGPRASRLACRLRQRWLSPPASSSPAASGGSKPWPRWRASQPAGSSRAASLGLSRAWRSSSARPRSSRLRGSRSSRLSAHSRGLSPNSASQLAWGASSQSRRSP